MSLTNSIQIANRFNNFFANCAVELNNSLSFDEEEFHSFHSKEAYDIVMQFNCPKSTEDEIKIIIENFSNSKALDYHGFSNFFVKYHKNSLIPHLNKLINQVLSSGEFPKCLKYGVITPIFKTGSKFEKSNYRPVTVSSVFGKVIEYVMLRRLEDHVNNNKIMNLNQFGYIKFSNPEIAAVHILNDIYVSLDKGIYF